MAKIPAKGRESLNVFEKNVLQGLDGGREVFHFISVWIQWWRFCHLSLLLYCLYRPKGRWLPLPRPCKRCQIKVKTIVNDLNLKRRHRLHFHLLTFGGLSFSMFYLLSQQKIYCSDKKWHSWFKFVSLYPGERGALWVSVKLHKK